MKSLASAGREEVQLGKQHGFIMQAFAVVSTLLFKVFCRAGHGTGSLRHFV
jgi:hypothetical protein